MPLDAGFEVAIVSIDKDFFQLVHDGIRVYDPREDGAWYDKAAVADKFGVAPSHVVDVLALAGDTSDNISGVRRQSEKRGPIDLIGAYGSLDALLDRAGELTQKKYRETLLAHRAEALRSRELVTIRLRRAARRGLRVASVPGAPHASGATSFFHGSRSAR